jgi:hypothetical protein
MRWSQWRSWIEGPIRGGVVGMNFRRTIWLDINGCCRSAGHVRRSGTSTAGTMIKQSQIVYSTELVQLSRLFGTA